MPTTPVLQSVQTLPNYIQVGPGMLWTQVSKPADGSVLLVSGNLTGPQDQRVYGPVPFTISGIFIGSTIGDSTFSYKPTFVDIQIETSTAKVEKVLNTETATVAFSVAELTAENVNLAIPIGTVTTQTDPLMSPQVQHNMKVGGLRLVQPQTIAFISPNRRISFGGPYSYVFTGYNAIAIDGFDAPFSRSKETVFKLTYELIADTARTIGDQLCCFTTRQ